MYKLNKNNINILTAGDVIQSEMFGCLLCVIKIDGDKLHFCKLSGSDYRTADLSGFYTGNERYTYITTINPLMLQATLEQLK